MSSNEREWRNIGCVVACSGDDYVDCMCFTVVSYYALWVDLPNLRCDYFDVVLL